MCPSGTFCLATPPLTRMKVGTFICDLQSMRVGAGMAQSLQGGPETLLENTFQINCLPDVAVI